MIVALFRRARKRIAQFVDMRNVDEVLVLGQLPTEWTLGPLRGAFENVVDLREPRLGSPHRLSSDRPKAVVLFIGDAEERGFRLPPGLEDQPAFLPHTFWDTGNEIHLFAYACWSAEYAHQQATEMHVAAVVGYSGLLWFSAESEAYWSTFLIDVGTALRTVGVADSRFFAHVQQLYVNRLIARSNGGDYLTKICLLSQSQALRLVPGRTP